MNSQLPILVTMLALSTACSTSQSPRTDAESPPYRVVDGRVDDATYRGWRAYHSACHTCHGLDAIGSSVAPSLVESVKRLSARDFSVKVLTSYRVVQGGGEGRADDPSAELIGEILRRERGELIMPAWQSDTHIRPHLLDLYAYLRSRADGALGPGPPEPIAE